jgi:hypothetical protein
MRVHFHEAIFAVLGTDWRSLPEWPRWGLQGGQAGVHPLYANHESGSPLGKMSLAVVLLTASHFRTAPTDTAGPP